MNKINLYQSLSSCPPKRQPKRIRINYWSPMGVDINAVHLGLLQQWEIVSTAASLTSRVLPEPLKLLIYLTTKALLLTSHSLSKRMLLLLKKRKEVFFLDYLKREQIKRDQFFNWLAVYEIPNCLDTVDCQNHNDFHLLDHVQAKTYNCNVLTPGLYYNELPPPLLLAV